MTKKTIILGLTGGIAVYKICDLISQFKKCGYDVRVIATRNALEFVTTLTFETLSGNKVVFDTFDKEREFQVEHISYAKLASAFVVAPATANFIAKLASGVADDMLTTTAQAMTAPIIVCPAMNTAMYNSDATTENIAKLQERGVIFVGPQAGNLACGDIGIGKMSDIKDIFDSVDKLLTPNPDFRGKVILITAGATREPIDAVRFITNHSSGKMGVALASAAYERGAKVILVAGHMTTAAPDWCQVISVDTTEDMYNAVMDQFKEADIIIKAAAPSDYKVKNFSKSKIKAQSLSLELVKNKDIAREVGQVKGNKKLIVFAAETDNLISNAMDKLASKNADMVVANDVTVENAGFNVDTNIATLITADGALISLEPMSKRALADVILDYVKEL
ncbi:MAG: bifunctional phosphopantothenoylcysteine decarboxylase/phosphopantothenate--cysteine ligase CoaBC [Christensenellaceae bacterium]|jgi:phosphopantothenoylcysteine decarboxylase/phosphopantothenate--cysteine ligase|nr:bifunctional phosphopantothenoylcysteine decarboxylase/phosphopantothenate--cysteine ligase CoaBC [Christensenellaceae bacterium]